MSKAGGRGGRNGRRRRLPGELKRRRSVHLTENLYKLTALRAARLGRSFSGHVEELILRDLRQAARYSKDEDE